MYEPCVHAEFCGGCRYMGMTYEDVLSLKETEVRGLMKPHLASGDIFFAGIEGCPEGGRFRYRNKMEYTFGDLVKGGDLQLGMHKKGSFMSVITVDHCMLVPEDFNRILRFTLDFAVSNDLPHYNKKTHLGVLRNLIVRRGVRTGEILVDIVTSSECEGCFDAGAWKDGILALDLDDRVVGVMHTINDGLADAVNCDEQRILFGRDYYYEELCGLRFKVSIFSFFQTNVEAVERLYSQAVSLLDDLEGKTVYDLFCGTGTISQIAARRAKQVIGVEIVRDSVDAARVNAGMNGIENCEFVCGDVFKVLSGLDQEGSEKTIPGPDVIIVDPPRMGLRTAAADKIASYGVPEILYVSCNPKTLAADITDLKARGYEPKYMKAYDNFCWTGHVEVATLLERASSRKADLHKKLHELQDLKYREMQIRIIPTVDPESIIGVRTPELRLLAKEILKSGDYAGFLKELPHEYFEENQLHAFILSGMKDFDECIAEVEKFLPYVDNWATCDQMSPKIFKKHREELLEHIKVWVSSERTYTVRFAAGMLMEHFLDDDYDPKYPEMVAALRSDEYYVNMMIAWYFATALAKQYDSVLPYIEEKRLDDWTHNKAIQKSIESRRITEEQKDYLRSLKKTRRQETCE